MSKFKDNFGGILLAYLNDTFYTLDNSQCNELTKLVQQLEDDNDRLTAERDAARAERNALYAAIEEIHLLPLMLQTALDKPYTLLANIDAVAQKALDGMFFDMEDKDE